MKVTLTIADVLLGDLLLRGEEEAFNSDAYECLSMLCARGSLKPYQELVLSAIEEVVVNGLPLDFVSVGDSLVRLAGGVSSWGRYLVSIAQLSPGVMMEIEPPPGFEEVSK